MMNLISLMEIWAMKNNSDDPTGMLRQGEFDSRIDLDILVGKIVEVCGAMHPVHSTSAEYEYFHKLFFKMWKVQISKLLDTIDIEYAPLENFRKEEELSHNADEGSKSDTSNKAGSSSKNKVTSNTENKTSAYNESVYQPENLETINGDEDKSSDSHYQTSNEKNRKFSSKDSNYMHGLNGLFSSQNLLEQERKVSEFNVYQWIVQKYMEEMFLCVF